jgi:hypothetical protein
LANTLFLGKSGVKQSASLTKLLSGPLTGDAVMLEKLRQAEKKFDVQMRKLDVEIGSLHVQDRNAARHRQEKLGDYWPNLLGVMILLCFCYNCLHFDEWVEPSRQYDGSLFRDACRLCFRQS